MQHWETPKKWIKWLTGLLFAAYAAYQVFIRVRDDSALPSEGKLITVIVAVMFVLHAVFIWTSEVRDDFLFFLRRTTFFVVTAVLFVLKLRMLGKVIDYLDASKPYTLMYGGALSRIGRGERDSRGDPAEP